MPHSQQKRDSKTHVCYFCCAEIEDKIRRHILQVHDEHDLILLLKTYGPQVCHDTVTVLINLGNYNADMEKESEGKELHGVRRPNRRKIVKLHPNKDGGLDVPKHIETVEPTPKRDKDGKIYYQAYDYDLPEAVNVEDYIYCIYFIVIKVFTKG